MATGTTGNDPPSVPQFALGYVKSRRFLGASIIGATS
jgi:hypothetical protein